MVFDATSHDSESRARKREEKPPACFSRYVQATLTKMALHYFKGEKMEDTLFWAEGECEGFMRSLA